MIEASDTHAFEKRRVLMASSLDRPRAHPTIVPPERTRSLWPVAFSGWADSMDHELRPELMAGESARSTIPAESQDSEAREGDRGLRPSGDQPAGVHRLLEIGRS